MFLCRLRRIEKRLTRLEQSMTRVDDVITDLNTATDEIANDLDALREQVSGLDAVTAGKFQPLVDRLRALGQDPENPVPDPGTPTA